MIGEGDTDGLDVLLERLDAPDRLGMEIRDAVDGVWMIPATEPDVDAWEAACVALHRAADAERFRADPGDEPTPNDGVGVVIDHLRLTRA